MNIQKIILLSISIFAAILGCNHKNTVNGFESAANIIDTVAVLYGANSLNNQTIVFEFRDKSYSLFHDDQGHFEYQRFWEDSVGSIRDVLTNDEFVRQVNNKQVNLTEKEITAFSNSVNSVLYFALLPIKLNDAAVKANLKGEVQIEGKLYYKVEVSFDQEGGGQDHDDKFVYWFNKDNFNMDFLAYSYATNGGGIRFREAIKRHEFNGLIFQDYINYKADPKKWNLADLDSAFNSGTLEELSRIELKNIRSL